MIGIFISCNNENKDTTYYIPKHVESLEIPLNLWNIKTKSPSFDSLYIPLYNQLDLREIGIDSSTNVHLSCTIEAKHTVQLYLGVKCEMPQSFLLNEDSLSRIDIQGLKIYTILLQKGKSTLQAEVNTTGEDWSFETTLYDSLSIAQLYAEGQSCNIIYPLIPTETKDIMLTNAHQNVLSSPVVLTFNDVQGKMVSEIILKKDSFIYHVPELEEDISYMCSMKIGKTLVRQPVLCGQDDNSLVKFQRLRQMLPKGHPRLPEIDGALYRLQFLLNHPTRYEGDWWWQFKITPLTYQLEHIFSHLEETYGTSDTEFNVNFISYRSVIDDSIQHYLLVTPNSIHQDEPLPLVVIVRPFCENYHHFFASPQLVRQWALNIVQGLANHHRFIVMMPEGRMPKNEDLTPMAEREIKLAIEDVKSHYNIDESKMYLQANCTGGYRALKFAEANPKLFAAIALYAPVYKVNYALSWSKQYTAKSQLAKLKDIPLMIHYDPLDEHSTPEQFEELVADCEHNGIPLTLSVKRNSGKFYNVVIAGCEAFEFFHGKQK